MIKLKSTFRTADYAAGLLPTVCIAHRGFSGRYPESTRLAFEKAIEVGADVIEFDVRMTADNQLIVFHDESLAKILGQVNGTRIDAMTLEELTKIDMGMGQRLMTMEEALELLAGRIGMNIHVKQPGEMFDRIIAALTAAGVLDQVFLAVEWKDEILRLQREYPDVWLCSLYHRTTPDLVEVNAALNVKLVQPTTDAMVKGGREMVVKAQQAGIVLGVFFADTFGQLQWMQQLGVAGIVTNFPDQMLQSYGRSREGRNVAQSTAIVVDRPRLSRVNGQRIEARTPA